jgi:hypothetical protein
MRVDKVSDLRAITFTVIEVARVCGLVNESGPDQHLSSSGCLGAKVTAVIVPAFRAGGASRRYRGPGLRSIDLADMECPGSFHEVGSYLFPPPVLRVQVHDGVVKLVGRDRDTSLVPVLWPAWCVP